MDDYNLSLNGVCRTCTAESDKIYFVTIVSYSTEMLLNDFFVFTEKWFTCLFVLHSEKPVGSGGYLKKKTNILITAQLSFWLFLFLLRQI